MNNDTSKLTYSAARLQTAQANIERFEGRDVDIETVITSSTTRGFNEGATWAQANPNDNPKLPTRQELVDTIMQRLPELNAGDAARIMQGITTLIAVKAGM